MILFRADGNEKIGLGHIMRCLSIAQALRDSGAEARFVAADHRCEPIITQKGFECIVLNTDYSDMESEFSAFERVIEELKPEIIVIDSYYVTENYLKSIGKQAKTVYIDDVLAFAYPVDILINYNVFSSQTDYDELYKRAEEKPRFVLGTDYVPLRKEFSDCAYRKPERVKNILVSTGGADTRHIAVKLLEYLNDNPEKLSDYCLKFIVGSVNRDIERIKELSDNLPNIELMIDVKNMKELMCGCDLAVSAAGSTLYELCVCSVPTITYVIADNQLQAARAFEQKGLMVNVGDLRDKENVGEVLYNSIKELIDSGKKRESMVKSAYELINKDGSNKIANIIKNNTSKKEFL